MTGHTPTGYLWGKLATTAKKLQRSGREENLKYWGEGWKWEERTFDLVVQKTYHFKTGEKRKPR